MGILHQRHARWRERAVMVYVVDDRGRSRRVENSAQVVIGFQQTERMEFHVMIDEIQSGVALDERVGAILEANESKILL